MTIIETTREQDNAIERLSIIHAGRLARYDHGIQVRVSPRSDCVYAHLPWNQGLHINEDGITVHVDHSAIADGPAPSAAR